MPPIDEFPPGSEAQDAAGPSHPTRALEQFLSSLRSRSRPVLLDLGPIVASNLAFFGEELGCKIFVEDVSREIDRHVRENRLAELPAFLTRRFSQWTDGVDGILCWDVFDYLDPASAQALATALVCALRPEGVLLAIFGTEEPQAGASPVYTRHVVVDRGNVRPHSRSAAKGKHKPFMNRDIERMFAPLRIASQFLLKTQMRELLFRKPRADA
jgi:hypothetical protein